MTKSKRDRGLCDVFKCYEKASTVWTTGGGSKIYVCKQHDEEAKLQMGKAYSSLFPKSLHIVPAALKVFLIRIKPEHQTQNAIVFAHSKNEVEKLKETVAPHFAGFCWTWVQDITQISEGEMQKLLDSEEAGLADI